MSSKGTPINHNTPYFRPRELVKRFGPAAVSTIDLNVQKFAVMIKETVHARFSNLDCAEETANDLIDKYKLYNDLRKGITITIKNTANGDCYEQDSDTRAWKKRINTTA